jgi:hypothetical protein
MKERITTTVSAAAKFLVVAVVVVSLFAAGCVGAGRQPHAFLPPIAEEYFVCDKCGSLHGGIYGKGPLASFETASAASCRHRWRKISKIEFQARAQRDFPREWAEALEFFKQPAPEPVDARP